MLVKSLALPSQWWWWLRSLSFSGGQDDVNVARTTNFHQLLRPFGHTARRKIRVFSPHMSMTLVCREQTHGRAKAQEGTQDLVIVEASRMCTRGTGKGDFDLPCMSKVWMWLDSHSRLNLGQHLPHPPGVIRRPPNPVRQRKLWRILYNNLDLTRLLILHAEVHVPQAMNPQDIRLVVSDFFVLLFLAMRLYFFRSSFSLLLLLVLLCSFFSCRVR